MQHYDCYFEGQLKKPGKNGNESYEGKEGIKIKRCFATAFFINFYCYDLYIQIKDKLLISISLI